MLDSFTWVQFNKQVAVAKPWIFVTYALHFQNMPNAKNWKALRIPSSNSQHLKDRGKLIILQAKNVTKFRAIEK